MVLEHFYLLFQARENYFSLSKDFLIHNPEVTSQMRAILMDWLIQVQVGILTNIIVLIFSYIFLSIREFKSMHVKPNIKMNFYLNVKLLNFTWKLLLY